VLCHLSIPLLPGAGGLSFSVCNPLAAFTENNMDEQQRLAYINGQIACAQIEAMGMNAENQRAALKGQEPPYGKEAFDGLINTYGIHHNAVISYLMRY
jgi:hypothetical protein